MDIGFLRNCYQALFLCAGDKGRAGTLFGSSYERARQAVDSFVLDENTPTVYLEFPLIGDPFLDLVILYESLTPGLYIDHPAAAGCEAAFDWFVEARKRYRNISLGFELDTGKEELPPAGIHFQPRRETQLVEPFCNAVGEDEKGQLYLDMADRMPKDWSLSYFGMFRGRPDSPLRVCGYLMQDEVRRCAKDREHVHQVFDKVGFTAYDANMLDSICKVLEVAPSVADFQMDVYPDGHMGDTFSLEMWFGIQTARQVREDFLTGPSSQLISLLQDCGIADARTQHVPDLALTQGIPYAQDDGSMRKCRLSLIPLWVKVRWKNGVLQPAKLYLSSKVTVE